MQKTDLVANRSRTVLRQLPQMGNSRPNQKGSNVRASGSAADAPPTIENLQALRGIAAFLVVWAHLKFAVNPLCAGVANYRLIHSAYGGIGVDLFFVISGYVICLTASKRHHQPQDFFLARIARVCPLYLVAFLPGLLYKCFAKWSSVTWASSWNGLFYLPIFDRGDYSEPPVGVGWTLSFEMWFYVAFALLLFIYRPDKVAIVLPLLFFIGAPLMTLFYHGSWYFPRFLFHPFVLEFAFGCVIFHVQKWMTGWTPWLPLAAGLIALVAFTQHTGDLGYHPILLSQRLDLAWLRVLLWGFPSALIAAGLIGLERNYGYTLPQALVWLGGISYSLYLSNRFSMIIIALVGNRIGLHNLYVVAAITFPFCVFMAWLCWKWIEQPLTTRAQRWAKQRTPKLKLTKKDAVALKPATRIS